MFGPAWECGEKIRVLWIVMDLSRSLARIVESYRIVDRIVYRIVVVTYQVHIVQMAWQVQQVAQDRLQS